MYDTRTYKILDRNFFQLMEKYLNLAFFQITEKSLLEAKNRRYFELGPVQCFFCGGEIKGLVIALWS